MSVRRVVTGHDDQGRSTVVQDAQVEPLTLRSFPGIEFVRLWSSDGPVSIDPVGRLPEGYPYVPRPDGASVVVVTIPPDPASAGDQGPTGADQEALAQSVAEMQEKLPGLVETFDPEAPGFHVHDTIDFAYVVSGHVRLLTTAGPPVDLAPGDTVVQNGTKHAWSNPGKVPAQVFFVSLGAHRPTTEE